MKKGLQKGFTLIEVMVVIVIGAMIILGVLSMVNGARTKAVRASNVTIAQTVLTDLASCQDNGGVAWSVAVQGAVPATNVCSIAIGSAATLPALKNGSSAAAGAAGLWTYAAPTGTLAGGNYKFTVVLGPVAAPTDTITCNFNDTATASPAVMSCK